MLSAFKVRLGWEASSSVLLLARFPVERDQLSLFLADTVEEELGVRKGSRGADFEALAQKNPTDSYMACVLKHAGGTSAG